MGNNGREKCDFIREKGREKCNIMYENAMDM